MNDPQAYARQQLGQLADDTKAGPSGSPDLAAAAGASAGLGLTSVDIDAINAQMAAMQARLDAFGAQQAKAGTHPLTGTVRSLLRFLEGHGDPVAAEHGQALKEAADAAVKTGDTTYVKQIAGKLRAHLTRNPPQPGENYYYRGAVNRAGQLDDAIDAVTPPPSGAAALTGTGGEPTKVLAGSVVASSDG